MKDTVTNYPHEITKNNSSFHALIEQGWWLIAETTAKGKNISLGSTEK